LLFSRSFGLNFFSLSGNLLFGRLLFNLLFLGLLLRNLHLLFFNLLGFLFHLDEVKSLHLRKPYIVVQISLDRGVNCGSINTRGGQQTHAQKQMGQYHRALLEGLMHLHYCFYYYKCIIQRITI